MRHQGTIAAIFAILVAMVVGRGAEAREADKPEDVSTQLRKLREDLETLKMRVDLDRQAMRDRFSDLDAKLDRIEALLRGRVSRSINPATNREGTIRLDNRLGVEARVTINGTTYTVAPLSVRELKNQPAGTFTYELTATGFGLTPSRRRTLGADEVWTLTIY